MVNKDTLIFSGLGIVAIAAIIFGVRSNMGTPVFDSTSQYDQSQAPYIQPESQNSYDQGYDNQGYNQQNQNPYQEDMRQNIQPYGGGKRKQSRKSRKSRKRKSKRFKK